MKDRILQFLSAEKISPAEFADKIGVQRSSMSHILNGRNYPSASFIQKMLHAYPLINSRWLMIGEGKMNIGPEKEIFRSQPVAENQIMPESVAESVKEKLVLQNSESKDITVSTSFDQKPEPSSSDSQNSFVSGNINAPEINFAPETTVPESKDLKTNGNMNHQQQPLPPMIPNHDEKEIEQILFFYKNKTFSLYRPS